MSNLLLLVKSLFGNDVSLHSCKQGSTIPFSGRRKKNISAFCCSRTSYYRRIFLPIEVFGSSLEFFSLHHGVEGYDDKP